MFTMKSNLGSSSERNAVESAKNRPWTLLADMHWLWTWQHATCKVRPRSPDNRGPSPRGSTRFARSASSWHETRSLTPATLICGWKWTAHAGRTVTPKTWSSPFHTSCRTSVKSWPWSRGIWSWQAPRKESDLSKRVRPSLRVSTNLSRSSFPFRPGLTRTVSCQHAHKNTFAEKYKLFFFFFLFYL